MLLTGIIGGGLMVENLNYYNDNEKTSAAWLHELIKHRIIPNGKVDDRSIIDVKPNDLKGFTQCHFFAGVAGWSEALRLANWPTDATVWTGSCPCQPFSIAGKGEGTNDERHLWPVWFDLIKQCRPSTVFGEQVSSAQVVGMAGAGSKIPTEISQEEPCSRLGEACEGKSNEKGNFIRPFKSPFGTTGEDRQWGVRIKRPTVQLGWWEDVGQSVNRQDRPLWRVHDEQCKNCLSCGKQCDGGLGGIQDVNNSEGYYEQASRSLQCAIRKARSEFDEIVGSEWLSGICADLESEGYVVGSSVLPAASVGAPHIRQRLWWVADANISGLERERQAQPEEWNDHIVTIGYGEDIPNTNKAGRKDTERWNGPAKQKGRERINPDYAGRWRRQWPAEPDVVRVVHGVSTTVGAVVGAFGNSIVPQVAAEFIKAYMAVAS
jgi:site-specific DNA-cytosine methylase